MIKTVSDAGQQTVVHRDGLIEVVSSNRYRMASDDTETILSFDEEVAKIVVGTVAPPIASSDVTNHIQTPRRHSLESRESSPGFAIWRDPSI